MPATAIITAAARGKIILSGEYAVVFGYPGIAIPSSNQLSVTFEEDRGAKELTVQCKSLGFDKRWKEYLREILGLCVKQKGFLYGNLVIENDLPLGKGMGSSTSLVVAAIRCLLGPDCKDQARAIENFVNPGSSGIDFAVIWHEKPVLFRKGQDLEFIDVNTEFLNGAVLIDTGAPHESTPELVAWVTERKNELEDALKAIGQCTERLAKGKPLPHIIRDHHRAQVALGVVPTAVQAFIADIEESNGCAKILGAGARSGGGGMVLALYEHTEAIQEIAAKHNFPTLSPQSQPRTTRSARAAPRTS